MTVTCGPLYYELINNKNILQENLKHMVVFLSRKLSNERRGKQAKLL